MDGVSWGDVAVIATLLAIAWRGGRMIGAMPGRMAKALHDHEEDCLGHDSARVRVAQAAANTAQRQEQAADL